MNTSCVLVFLMALSAPVFCQSPVPPKTFLKTFTSPDGAFQFRYTDTLILCPNQGQGKDAPAKCSAFIPVCDLLVPEQYTSVVCLAYPRNAFTDSDMFEAATFSVEVLKDKATADSCAAAPTDPTFERRAPVKINGISFTTFDFGEGATGQSGGGTVYRAFHGGKCYQLGIDSAAADPGAFDPPARELTQRDWAHVRGALQKARDSFRFLH